MKKIKPTKAQLDKAFAGVNREALAKALSKTSRDKKRKCTRNVIDQIASGHSRVSAERAILIEKYAGISRSVLRPDIFGVSA